MAKKEEPKFIDTATAAALVGVSKVTMERWRTMKVKRGQKRHGPPWYRHGPKRVRYVESEVIKWKISSKKNS